MGAALTWVRYKVCAQRGLGDRALDRSAGGSGMVVAVRVCVYGSPRDLWRGSPWGRRWRMEERGELVRRAGEGGMHSTVAGGRRHRCRGGSSPGAIGGERPPPDAPMSSRGTLPRGEEVVCRPPPRHNSSSAA